MDYQYKADYSNLSDKELVERILAEKGDDEAAVYLLHVRYAPLLHNIYARLVEKNTWYEDCLVELFIHLKGKDCRWRPLANFEWRSTLGYWLKGVAWNKFKDILPKLIEKSGRSVSIDEEDSDKPKIQIPDVTKADIERRQRKVMLMEAIGLLEDDHQFVILKQLEGYTSSEIAVMLQEKWDKNGIKKYNNKHEVVIATEKYVNSCRQKAKIKLKIIMLNL